MRHSDEMPLQHGGCSGASCERRKSEGTVPVDRSGGGKECGTLTRCRYSTGDVAAPRESAGNCRALCPWIGAVEEKNAAL